MKGFFLKHTTLSGIIVGVISFILYFFVANRVLMSWSFGHLPDSEVATMGGFMIVPVILLAMGISIILSVFSGIIVTKYLMRKDNFNLK